MGSDDTSAADDAAAAAQEQLEQEQKQDAERKKQLQQARLAALKSQGRQNGVGLLPQDLEDTLGG